MRKVAAARMMGVEVHDPVVLEARVPELREDLAPVAVNGLRQALVPRRGILAPRSRIKAPTNQQR